MTNRETLGAEGSGGEEQALAERANRLYWESEMSVNRIAQELGLSKGGLYDLVEPFATGFRCPECGLEMAYLNRTARLKGFLGCPACAYEVAVESLEESGQGAESAEAVEGPEAGDRPPAGEGHVPAGDQDAAEEQATAAEQEAGEEHDAVEEGEIVGEAAAGDAAARAGAEFPGKDDEVASAGKDDEAEPAGKHDEAEPAAADRAGEGDQAERTGGVSEAREDAAKDEVADALDEDSRPPIGAPLKSRGEAGSGDAEPGIGEGGREGRSRGGAEGGDEGVHPCLGYVSKLRKSFEERGGGPVMAGATLLGIAAGVLIVRLIRKR